MELPFVACSDNSAWMRFQEGGKHESMESRIALAEVSISDIRGGDPRRGVRVVLQGRGQAK